jgi:hypothetical protein
VIARYLPLHTGGYATGDDWKSFLGNQEGSLTTGWGFPGEKTDVKGVFLSIFRNV